MAQKFFVGELSLRRTRKRWEISIKMNAIFEVLTAVLIMIPVFLDYPEDGDSKLRTKLWCLNDLS
jgi:hypothetical protein